MYVKVFNLDFSYNKTNVIKDFNLEIKEGEILAILGQSGSGKSTLLRLLSGLEEPDKGSIIINNKVVVNDSVFIEPEDRNVGLVFQDYALFPHMLVGKNIGYGLTRLSKIEKQKRVSEVLKLVNLEEYHNRYPYELSGGQQQRVALARALAPKPALLLLDEPFSNLDADLKIKIRNDLRKILKETNSTSVFVTHDKLDAQVLADRIVFLDQGKIQNIINVREKTD